MSSTAPKIDNTVASGSLEHNEKHATPTAPVVGQTHTAAKPTRVEDDDEDEDMDALIDELESQDGAEQLEEDEEEEAAAGGEAPPVPEELLQTDTRRGLTEAEVVLRRKKYGLNQMKEEKENLILKFLSYFVGPIQFVMEVSTLSSSFRLRWSILTTHRRCRYISLMRFANISIPRSAQLKTHAFCQAPKENSKKQSLHFDDQNMLIHVLQ